MKRLVLILIYAIFPLFASGQELERFSPSWTFEVPGTTKAELEERAYAFRMRAEKEVGMTEMPMYDTKHRTLWILSSRHTPELGRLHSLISTYVAVLCEDGRYTVEIEKLEATAYNGAFRISDDLVITEDESAFFSNKKVLRIIRDAKVFAIQQVEDLLPLIREKMETQDIQFELVQVN